MEEVRRQRLVYIILALFLGMFGVHNFYAGRIKYAVIQLILGITVILSPVSWIWAIIDICVVTKDGDGRIMQ